MGTFRPRLILPPAMVFAVLLAALALPAAASGAEPDLDDPNECVEAGGQGVGCHTSDECAANAFATLCVARPVGDPRPDGLPGSCRIPCQEESFDGYGDPTGVVIDRAGCALGETCVEGKLTGAAAGEDQVFFCQPARFRMDLNLLDQCIATFLGGEDPVPRDSVCSLEANLTRLLDQNQDGSFDIFDLDLCVLAFLEQPGCTRFCSDDPHRPCAADTDCAGGASCDAWRCDATDLVQCLGDEDCGAGLYCDGIERGGRQTCQRDCGLIASREEDVDTLDRECSGALKTCARASGRCVAVDLSEEDAFGTPKFTCDVDGDCPAGAYCFLGRCAAHCYRALDCPSSAWYCTANNRCRALPPPAAASGSSFDPQNYAVRFARDELRLDLVQDTERSALLVMDLTTKQQVRSDPSIGFGYRLLLEDWTKLDTQCLKPFVVCSDAEQRPDGETEADCEARQADCFIDDTEEWVRLPAPFGTVSAAGEPAISVSLERAVAERLTPGRYSVSLRAVFDNGDSDRVTVTYTKLSPSGEYDGSLTVYRDEVEYALNAARPLRLALRLQVRDDVWTRWNDLLDENNLGETGNAGFEDVTEGYLVRGELHGGGTLAFTRGDAETSAENEIPFVGLYSPRLQQLRMVGIIDIAGDFCAPAADEGRLRVCNPFGRPIRRQIELLGVFDEALGRYHGLYREKIEGLLPGSTEYTLSGGFILDQSVVDGSPIDDPGPLVSNTPTLWFAGPAAVYASLLPALESACDVPAGQSFVPMCETQTGGICVFSNQWTLEGYLEDADRSPGARTTIFPDLLQFEGAVRQALDALGDDSGDRQAWLNVYDFLANRVGFADPDDPSPSPLRLAEADARCGLALHQYAFVEGFVREGALGDERGHELFCPDTLPLADCPPTPVSSSQADLALFALQEHNRFWLSLAQTLKFEGDRARSDAFLVLYRNEANPFARGSALAYKSERLREALADYDALTELAVGPAAAYVLYNWPAGAFRGGGEDWLTILHTVVADRMEVLADLVDLERRQFQGTGEEDFVFAHHLMQYEYLTQVYLMALEERWKGDLDDYAGEAGAVLEKGQSLLNQLNPVKNALGVTSDQVFFENPDTSTTNWVHYREVLVGADGDGGLLGDTREEVAAAVDELHSALGDVDTLEERLRAARGVYEETLQDVCGYGGAATDEPCQYLLEQFDDVDRLLAWQRCVFGTPAEGDPPCPADLATYQCTSRSNALFGGDNCAEIAAAVDALPSTWTPATSDCTGDVCSVDADAGTDTVEGPSGWTTGVVCELEREQYGLQLFDQPVPCAGGLMGAAIQEKALVDLQRRQTLLRLRSAIGGIEDLVTYDTKVGDLGSQAFANQSANRWIVYAINIARDIMNGWYRTTTTAIEGVNCFVIVGFSFGTNCPGKAVGSVAIAGMNATVSALDVLATEVINTLNAELEQFLAHIDGEVGTADMDFDMRTAVGAALAILDELAVLNQQSFNLTLRIEDLRARAQAAADSYADDVHFIADHLVGRETGDVLRGDALVADASESFREVVLYAYKMAMAFTHHYNVPPGDARALVNRALSLSTVDDVADFVEELTERERDYCGLAAIDCDAATNVEVLRFSVREQLFPQLRDVVDGRTGRVVTAAEQFSALVMQPPYLHRRVRGTYATDQIELPLTIPVTVLERADGGGARWLVDPLSCNQLLDARDPTDPVSTTTGNVAVNVRGANLGDGERAIRYELIRGSVDFIRACEPESVVDEPGTLPVAGYPIRKYVVGYAPQSLQADKDAPPSYFTRSNRFSACIDADERAGDLDAAGCWRFFARDRSLAAPDWKLVIPLSIDGAATESAWITGEGLPEAQRPVIEDIVLYFRYRSRPIQED